MNDTGELAGHTLTMTTDPDGNAVVMWGDVPVYVPITGQAVECDWEGEPSPVIGFVVALLAHQGQPCARVLVRQVKGREVLVTTQFWALALTRGADVDDVMALRDQQGFATWMDILRWELTP